MHHAPLILFCIWGNSHARMQRKFQADMQWTWGILKSLTTTVPFSPTLIHKPVCLIIWFPDRGGHCHPPQRLTPQRKCWENQEQRGKHRTVWWSGGESPASIDRAQRSQPDNRTQGDMGGSQSVDIPGGGTEGYHVLTVRAVLRHRQNVYCVGCLSQRRGTCC